MTPGQELVLNTIAAGEAPDYNTLYGGHRVTDLSQHPAIPIPIRGTNQTSTAAGRYQILKPTWDKAASALGLKDFRPDSQDEAAWWIAQNEYQKNTGRNLEADAASNSVNWSALTSQWPSLRRLLPRVSGPNASGLVDKIPLQPGAASGPRILSQAASYQPISGNDLMPQGGPSFIPIDYDPFEGVSK